MAVISADVNPDSAPRAVDGEARTYAASRSSTAMTRACAANPGGDEAEGRNRHNSLALRSSLVKVAVWVAQPLLLGSAAEDARGAKGC